MTSLSGYSQKEKEQVKIENEMLADSLHCYTLNKQTNLIAYSGPDGLLLVDAGYEKTGYQLKEELVERFDLPVQFIINTHWHDDHTGGNKILGEGATIIAHHYVKSVLSRNRTSPQKTEKAFPVYAQPNITFHDSLDLTFNNQDLQLIHLSGGHTDGDILVYFPASNVLAVGDLLFADKFPYIDLKHGGNVRAYIDHLNWIVESYPEDTRIVGGHGPVYTMDQLKSYAQNLQETLDIVEHAIEQDLSMQEMIDTRILKDYESYGTGFISEKYWIYTIVSNF
jgi:glyoxylase-like metal-dependent hydrolase (beta-lactamase superfamily II)